ncbi:MAG TPA: hypothetical protein DCZ91_22820 [Lachnospiraceae bacterium]|nr:hypothetical protein [Lachnospiraceae bacterium]
MMEAVQDMTVDEKKDMLLEMLADLYTIKAANKEENTVLDHKIKVTEKRLEILGVTDLADLKP